jgi:hypothetical protein
MADEMKSNQEEFFSKYYDDGLRIRAICDDLDYPSEYFPVLLNIHIKGSKHFYNKEKQDVHKIAYKMLMPESQEMLLKSRLKKDNHIKALFSKIIIGGELKRADDYLLSEAGVENFFKNQLININRMYTDEYYRKKMIKIYEENVKQLIYLYDEERINKAFERGRLLNGISRN